MPMLLVHKAHLSSKGFQQVTQPHSHSPTWLSHSALLPQIHEPSKQCKSEQNCLVLWALALVVAHSSVRITPVCHGQWSQCGLCTQRRPSHAAHLSFLSFAIFLSSLAQMFSPVNLGLHWHHHHSMEFKNTQKALNPVLITWNTKCSTNVHYYQ